MGRTADSGERCGLRREQDVPTVRRAWAALARATRSTSGATRLTAIRTPRATSRGSRPGATGVPGCSTRGCCSPTPRCARRAPASDSPTTRATSLDAPRVALASCAATFAKAVTGTSTRAAFRASRGRCEPGNPPRGEDHPRAADRTPPVARTVGSDGRSAETGPRATSPRRRRPRGCREVGWYRDFDRPNRGPRLGRFRSRSEAAWPAIATP